MKENPKTKKQTLKGKNTRSLREIEELVREQTVRKQTEAAILGVVGIVGIVTIAALAPGVASILRPFAPSVREYTKKQTISRTIFRLMRRGELVYNDSLRRYELTQAGQQHLAVLLAKHHTWGRRKAGTSKRRWDGKWRIVIFDVAEKYRAKRVQLRRVLIETGFYKLQNSVWVYPFQCDEVVALIKADLSLGYHALYIIADAIEHDAELRTFYNLPAQS